MSDEWVDRRLTATEAERLHALLQKLNAEKDAQFELQGATNTPADYESLMSNDPQPYFYERYGEVVSND